MKNKEAKKCFLLLFFLLTNAFKASEVYTLEMNK